MAALAMETAWSPIRSKSDTAFKTVKQYASPEKPVVEGQSFQMISFPISPRIRLPLHRLR